MTRFKKLRERLRQHLADHFNLSIPDTPQHKSRLPVSTNFKHAAHDSSTIAALCYCSRFHFVSDGDFDEGELERYRENARLQPDRFIEHADIDQIRIARVHPYSFVIECDCNFLRHYEDFFWQNRHVVAEYFRLRAATAEREARLVQQIADDASMVEINQLRGNA